MHDNATYQKSFGHDKHRSTFTFSGFRVSWTVDTCAARLVAPALNEPYIQYRACKENKLNRYNVINNMHINVFENA